MNILLEFKGGVKLKRMSLKQLFRFGGKRRIAFGLWFALPLDAGVTGNYQANPAFYKTLVEVKLFISRSPPVVRQALMRSSANHTIRKFHVADAGFVE
jgi:hypothetical protein